MKNKIFKTLSATALAACMAAMSVMGVYAAGPDTIDTTKTGSLTITKYDVTAAQKAGVDTDNLAVADGEQDGTVESAMSSYALQGVKFTYLKVSDIISVSDGGSIHLEYDLPDALDSILGLGTEAHEADDINTALASALSSANTATKNALEEYIVSAGGTTMTETDANGVTSASDLALGLYLVVETAVPEEVQYTTDPFFVSIPMTDATGDYWNYDVYVYPKNQTDNPTIDKVVKQDEDDATFKDIATASEGDVVTYRLVSKLPSITSEASYLTKYTFVDTLSTGLTYNQDATIYLYASTADATAVQQGTVTEDAKWTTNVTTPNFTATYDTSANTMTIAMTEAGLAAINPDYANYYLVVEYTVTVNSNATPVLGDSGNPNTVALTYSRTNQLYENTIEDKANVYTYGINLTKTFDDGKGDPTDVQFVIQNTSDGYYLVATGSNGVYYLTGKADSEDDATKFSPADDGSLIINGLEADTYTMTEIQTADGYSLLKNDIIIVISQTVDTITPSVATVTGIANSNDEIIVTAGDRASAKVDDSATTMAADGDSTNARVVMSVVNSSSFTLPQTGGLGTILFTLGGALIIVFGVLYVNKSKKTA